MKKIAEALRREVASFVLGLSLLFGSSSYAEVMPPTISSFNPLSATNGASVTITGTNFSETLTNNIVWFGAVQATVQSASATNLVATVPIGARSIVSVWLAPDDCDKMVIVPSRELPPVTPRKVTLDVFRPLSK